MKNLNEMTSKELKAMAKELGIKNWWNLTKAALISAIEEVNLDEEDEDIEELDTIEDEEDIEELESVEDIIGQDSIEDQEADAKRAEAETEKKAPRGKQIEWNGKSQNLGAWAKELGFTRQTLYARLYLQNWDVEKAFTTPARKEK